MDFIRYKLYLIYDYIINRMFHNSKYIFYFFHILYIFITLFIPFIYYQFMFFQLLTIISWKINDNRCILTQFEYFLYRETLINIFYKDKKNNFKVPYKQRFTLYIFFIVNIFYHIIQYMDFIIFSEILLIIGINI